MNLIMPFNKEISDKIGRRLVLVYGAIVIPVCALGCSFTDNLVWFSIIYGLGIGSAIGICLATPYMMIYEYIFNNFY